MSSLVVYVFFVVFLFAAPGNYRTTEWPLNAAECTVFTVNAVFRISISLEVMQSSLPRRTSCGGGGGGGDWAKPVCAAQLLYPIFAPECLASLHQQPQSEPSITLFDQRAHGQCSSLEGSHICAEWK